MGEKTGEEKKPPSESLKEIESRRKAEKEQEASKGDLPQIPFPALVSGPLLSVACSQPTQQHKWPSVLVATHLHISSVQFSGVDKLGEMSCKQSWWSGGSAGDWLHQPTLTKALLRYSNKGQAQARAHIPAFLCLRTLCAPLHARTHSP